jgi:hypothetical protein
VSEFKQDNGRRPRGSPQLAEAVKDKNQDLPAEPTETFRNVASSVIVSGDGQHNCQYNTKG